MTTPPIAPANEEAIEAWDGVLFDRFSRFRHIILPGLARHGEEAMRAQPPRRGERALDVGCGFGDTTRRLGQLVGPGGDALGVDASPRFVATARREAEQAGARNVRFEVIDVEAAAFPDRFDYAYSRFGTMFFANPVAALRNVRRALAPGGRLCMVVWRRKLEIPWLHDTEAAVAALVSAQEQSDEPTCGPGPFSMADADVTSQILLNAGFEEVALRRCDIPMRIGRDIAEASAYVMALGPAAELIRLAGDEGRRRLPEIAAAVRRVLARFASGDGVVGPTSTWIVTARAPAEGPAE